VSSARIGVIDHGAGNLVSIAQGIRRAGAEPVQAATPTDLEGVDGIVLPGVGATATVMEGIRKQGFVEPLAAASVPILGICVGMQALFSESEEDGTSCLGLIEGSVRKLAGVPRLPHIGWNDVDTTADRIFAGLDPNPTFYFVHSYAPVPEDPEVVAGRTEYGTSFVAAVRRGSLSGTQFHPERSGAHGLALLRNFVSECLEAARAA